jgi:hypothetical protein
MCKLHAEKTGDSLCTRTARDPRRARAIRLNERRATSRTLKK